MSVVEIKPDSAHSYLGRMSSLRAQLLEAAAGYVRLGKSGCRAERLRTASQFSGYPINLIDVEAERQERHERNNS